MKFRVLIEGKNFLVALDHPRVRKHGFYVTAHVEAQTEEQAEALAFDLVRANDRLQAMVQNSADDRPQLVADEIACIAEWPSDVATPLTGFAWYAEQKAEPIGAKRRERGTADAAGPDQRHA